MNNKHLDFFAIDYEVFTEMFGVFPETTNLDFQIKSKFVT